MSEYRVTWKSGEIVLLEGDDIADAFNRVGYVKLDIDAIANYHEVIRVSKDHPEFPLADFSCPQCQAILESVYEYLTYRYVCPECNYLTPPHADELRAKIIMNLALVTGKLGYSDEDIEKIAKKYDIALNEYYESGT
jgi:hypothetical protein